MCVEPVGDATGDGVAGPVPGDGRAVPWSLALWSPALGLGHEGMDVALGAGTGLFCLGAGTGLCLGAGTGLGGEVWLGAGDEHWSPEVD